jgi:hypothetical protein
MLRIYWRAKLYVKRIPRVIWYPILWHRQRVLRAWMDQHGADCFCEPCGTAFLRVMDAVERTHYDTINCTRHPIGVRLQRAWRAWRADARRTA